MQNSRPPHRKITLIEFFVITLITLVAASCIYALCFKPKVEPLTPDLPDHDTSDLPAEPDNDISADSPIEAAAPQIETIDGVTYIDGILIVNKSYPLPANYGNDITPEAQAAFETMRQAASTDGINLTIVSGFRSYDTQKWLYQSYVDRDGNTASADRYSARAGYSEHQSGLAMDLNWVDTDFAYTPAGEWLHHNAWKYGFILRYPEGSEDLAGFIYEPWHFRYIGNTTLAEQLYNGGNWITLEEHFGIVSKYAE